MPDFDKIFPWSEIHDVEVDGQAMVEIPRFYIRNEVLNDGAAYAGKYAVQISDRPKTGFHIHPAFVYNGSPLSCFQYGAYEASMEGYPNGDRKDSNNIRAFTDVKACSLAGVHVWNYQWKEEAATVCELRNTGEAGSEQYGWHLHNVYEVYAIAYLMLVEYGAPNMQDLIGRGNVDKTWVNNTTYPKGKDETVLTGASDAVWRGIHELWGNCWEHVDGITTDANGVMSILANTMTGAYVTTSYAGPDTYEASDAPGTSTGCTTFRRRRGFMKSFSHLTGTNYDLGDIIAPSAMVGDSTTADTNDGTIHDYSWYTAKNMWATTQQMSTTGNNRPATNLFVHGSFNYGSAVGPFVFSVNHGNADARNGFRLARRPES